RRTWKTATGDAICDSRDSLRPGPLSLCTSRRNTRLLCPGNMKDLLRVTTLNVNGLNSPAKRHHIALLLKRYVSGVVFLQETHFRGDRCLALP
ncbi:hypothetical protein GDO78_019324, partial [Eleutherodactylus coqui]